MPHGRVFLNLERNGAAVIFPLNLGLRHLQRDSLRVRIGLHVLVNGHVVRTTVPIQNGNLGDLQLAQEEVVGCLEGEGEVE